MGENNFCTKCGEQSRSNFQTTRKRSPLWYLLPIVFGLAGGVFGIIGGVIAYFVLKNSDPKKAVYCLIIGIIFTVIGLFLGSLTPMYFPDFTQMLEDFGYQIGFNIGENLF